MKSVNQKPSWSLGPLGPGQSTILGAVVGLAAALAAAFNPPRDFSYQVLMVLSLGLGTFGAVGGYLCWLLRDPLMGEKLVKVANLLALSLIIGLSLAFPTFWWEMMQPRSHRWILMVMFIGFIFSLGLFLATAGFGIVQFAGHLAQSAGCFFCRTRLPHAPGGMWDRELDP